MRHWAPTMPTTHGWEMGNIPWTKKELRGSLAWISKKPERLMPKPLIFLLTNMSIPQNLNFLIPAQWSPTYMSKNPSSHWNNWNPVIKKSKSNHLVTGKQKGKEYQSWRKQITALKKENKKRKYNLDTKENTSEEKSSRR